MLSCTHVLTCRGTRCWAHCAWAGRGGGGGGGGGGALLVINNTQTCGGGGKRGCSQTEGAVLSQIRLHIISVFSKTFMLHHCNALEMNLLAPKTPLLLKAKARERLCLRPGPYQPKGKILQWTPTDPPSSSLVPSPLHPPSLPPPLSPQIDQTPRKASSRTQTSAKGFKDVVLPGSSGCRGGSSGAFQVPSGRLASLSIVLPSAV